MLTQLKTIWQGLFKEGFVRNVFLLSSGALINIGLNVFLTPIVTRLYDRDDYGMAALFTSIVNIAVLVGTLMYPSAIVIPRENSTAYNLARLSFALMGSLLVAAGLLYATGIVGWFVTMDLAPYASWLFLIPLALLILTFDQTTAALNVRAKEFKRNVQSNVLSGVLNKGITIGAGVAVGSTQLGIIGGFLISHFIASIVRIARSFREVFLTPWRFQDLREAALRFVNYPKYILPGDFVNRFSRDLPLYLFALWYSIDLVGSFAFAIAMLTIPYNLISASVSPAFVQKAVELKQTNPSRLGEFVSKINSTAFLLGLLPFSIVAVFGGELFAIIFSAQWKQAGVFAGYLSLYFIFRLITSPMSSIFRVYEKERTTLIFNIFLLISRFASLYCGYLFLSIDGTILAFSVVSAVAYIILMILSFRLVGLSWYKSLLKYVVLYYLAIGVLYALKHFVLELVF